MIDKENDSEKTEPIRPPSEADGQNPLWPGDATLLPGVTKEPPDGETEIPLVR
jgi:hypothetical protein